MRLWTPRKNGFPRRKHSAEGEQRMISRHDSALEFRNTAAPVAGPASAFFSRHSCTLHLQHSGLNVYGPCGDGAKLTLVQLFYSRTGGPARSSTLSVTRCLTGLTLWEWYGSKYKTPFLAHISSCAFCPVNPRHTPPGFNSPGNGWLTFEPGIFGLINT